MFLSSPSYKLKNDPLSFNTCEHDAFVIWLLSTNISDPTLENHNFTFNTKGDKLEIVISAKV